MADLKVLSRISYSFLVCIATFFVLVLVSLPLLVLILSVDVGVRFATIFSLFTPGVSNLG